MSFPTKLQRDAWHAFETYKAGIEIKTAHFTAPFHPDPPVEPRKYVRAPILIDRFLVQHPEYIESRAYLIESYGSEDRTFIVNPSAVAD